MLSTLARADGRLSWWQKQTQPSLPFSELRKKGDRHEGPRAPAPPYPQSQAALRCNQGETLACSWLEGERKEGGTEQASLGPAMDVHKCRGHTCRAGAESDPGPKHIEGILSPRHHGQTPIIGSIQLPCVILAVSCTRRFLLILQYWQQCFALWVSYLGCTLLDLVWEARERGFGDRGAGGKK